MTDDNDNIIMFGKHHAKKMAEWQATIELSKSPDGRWSADITGFKDDPRPVPERLRDLSEGLEGAAFSMRQTAENMDPSMFGPVVASVVIYENSTVKVRVDPSKNDTDERKAWLDERLDDAKKAARQP